MKAIIDRCELSARKVVPVERQARCQHARRAGHHHECRRSERPGADGATYAHGVLLTRPRDRWGQISGRGPRCESEPGKSPWVRHQTRWQSAIKVLSQTKSTWGYHFYR